MIVVDDFGDEVLVADHGAIWSKAHQISKGRTGPYVCLRCGATSQRPQFDTRCRLKQEYASGGFGSDTHRKDVKAGLHSCLWPDEKI